LVKGLHDGCGVYTKLVAGRGNAPRSMRLMRPLGSLDLPAAKDWWPDYQQGASLWTEFWQVISAAMPSRCDVANASTGLTPFTNTATS